jgi:hypothetical protein
MSRTKGVGEIRRPSAFPTDDDHQEQNRRPTTDDRRTDDGEPSTDDRRTAVVEPEARRGTGGPNRNR